MKKKIIIFIALVFVSIFALKTVGKISTPRRTKKETTGPPITYNLGINFDGFSFTKSDLSHYNNKVFLENGDVLSGPDGKEMIPHPMYVLPPGTEILSVTDGKVVDIQYQNQHDDYSLVVQPSDSSWTIDYDHVTNVKVKKGDAVTAGQVIAEVSLAVGGLRQSNLGFTEVMIFEDSGFGGNNPTACVYNLLDESVKEEFHERIYKLVADWEEFKGDENIYDEDSWESPGCIVNEINEGDTHL